MSTTACGFCDNRKIEFEWQRIRFKRTPDDRTVIDCPYCDGTGQAPGKEKE